MSEKIIDLFIFEKKGLFNHRFKNLKKEEEEEESEKREKRDLKQKTKRKRKRKE